MKVEEYITQEDYDIYVDFHDRKTLPSGSFVKPIHEGWVPDHVKTTRRLLSNEIYVYCRYGIVVINKKILRMIG